MKDDKKNGSATGGDNAVRFSPDRITSITVELAEKMKRTIDAIEKINTQSKILAVNAKVESARAGKAGNAFSVVANEMSALSNEISGLVKKLEKETQVEFQEIARLNEYFATNFRGTRLSDIALTNIDLVDRNLYERSCDVRWWATDQSIVDALEQQTPQACQYASMRLGVILNSYTVYFDLVLSDCAGNIIANGRKDKYPIAGKNVSDARWFKAAMSCQTGDDYQWESVHYSDLVDNEPVLIFTTAVREKGKPNGAIIGALGIVFRYESLTQPLVNNIQLSDEEKNNSRICIVDDTGLILADSDEKMLQESIDFKHRDQLFSKQKGFVMDEFDNAQCCIAHARAPGFETFTTGWHSLIIQKV